ncbi:MAG TPA: GatB/YqeY domain-containing protein [Candidatus Paceibacterota bacterium]
MLSNIHQTIKDQIKTAMRAHDTIRLEVLRGLQALFLNELIAKKSLNSLVKDSDALMIIKKSVKQRKDSIEQFEKGDRKDLVKKEKAELKILEEFMPEMMSKEEIKKIVEKKIEKELGKEVIGGKKVGKDGDGQRKTIDPKKAGQFIGTLMKELKDKADGALVKAVVDEMIKG